MSRAASPSEVSGVVVMGFGVITSLTGSDDISFEAIHVRPDAGHEGRIQGGHNMVAFMPAKNRRMQGDELLRGILLADKVDETVDDGECAHTL